MLRAGILLFLAHVAGAQSRPGATVSGLVWDSLAHAPLAGARVQLVTADSLAAFSRTTISDSLGRFTFSDIGDGRYLAGFFHPMLDSIGIESPRREVRVSGAQPTYVSLAIPSAGRLEAAFCPIRATAASSARAVVVGVLLDARSREPIAAATVSADWLELSVGRGGIASHPGRRSTTTAENGWFALCGVPSGGTAFLVAERVADRTDTIEVKIPAEGFLRRELYIAAAQTTGPLSGSVVRLENGRPIADAEVAVIGGPRAHTNDRGEWSLSDAPAGTRMLEIRAVGFYPIRRPVDVAEGAPPVRSALSTMSAVLDTVKVTAARQIEQQVGFEQRHRTGQGYYITAEDVARRAPFETSDLLRLTPSVVVDPLNHDSTSILMRGGIGDGPENLCHPAIYINGTYMSHVGVDELDAWANPDEIVGIEVYARATMPPQFERQLSGCGSILVWTRPPLRARRVDGRFVAASLAVLAGVAVLFSSLTQRAH